MAANDIPLRDTGLGDIQALVNLFRPQSGSSTTTTTNAGETSTNGSSSNSTSRQFIDPEGMKAMIKSILESNTGLAATNIGQHTAGMYNSSTQKLLNNDLLARAAAEASKAQTTVTSGGSGGSSTKAPSQSVTNTEQMKPAGLNAGMAVAGLLGTQLLGKGYKSLSDMIAAQAGTVAADGSFIGPGSDMMNGLIGPPSDLMNGLIGPSADLAGSGTSGSLAASDLIGPPADLAMGSSDLVGPAADLASSDLVGPGVELANAAGLGEAGGGVEGLTTLEAGGAEAGLGAAAAAEGGADFVGPIAAAVLWIICTELHTQGKMPTRYYIPGARVFASYPEAGKPGYYIWAIPCVKHLRAKPNSIFSKFLSYVFNARAEMFAHKACIRGARNRIAGHVTEAILYPTCWVLGHAITHLGFAKHFNPMSIYAGSK